MKTIKFTPEFDKWFHGINDTTTNARLTARLKKAKFGLLGDVKSVGECVWEMRDIVKAIALSKKLEE